MSARWGVVAAGIALAGCADPYAGEFGPTPGSGEKAAHAQSPRPPARADAAAVARSFCREWSNWSWQTMRRKRRRLARLAGGALRHSLRERPQLAGPEAPTGLAHRGAVVALEVAPGGSARRVVCVTRERHAGAAKASIERYVVYLGRLRRAVGGWAMHEWSPQP